MQLISFDDTCVIKRNSGNYDEYDNPIQEVLYEGVCYYQEGGHTNAQRMFMRNPILFLPEVSVLVDTNDIATIKTKFGRKLEAVVNIPREIELPITRQRVTRLELKQATE